MNDPRSDGPADRQVRVDSGLQYVTRDGAALTGVLYRPAQDTPCPVIIAVHGGGWRQGSPQRYQDWGQWLARRGFALFAIHYRLTSQPRHVFPAAAQDVVAATRFIQSQSAALDLDPRRIALMGDSAGAHLVSLIALTRGSLGPATDNIPADDLQIRAVIVVYGVYDLLAQWEHDQLTRPSDQITEKLLGSSPLDDKLAYLKASPITYTTTKAPRTSFLVAWGTEDDIVDHKSQSERFVTALKQSGQFVRTVPIVGAPHFWIEQPIAETGSFTGFLAPKLHRFLQERM